MKGFVSWFLRITRVSNFRLATRDALAVGVGFIYGFRDGRRVVAKWLCRTRVHVSYIHVDALNIPPARGEIVI